MPSGGTSPADTSTFIAGIAGVISALTGLVVAVGGIVLGLRKRKPDNTELLELVDLLVEIRRREDHEEGDPPSEGP